MKKIIPLLAVCLLLGACKQQTESAANNTAAQKPVQQQVKQAPTETAKTPALTTKTLDGKQWKIEDHRGKWVVVNYWATWCAPCLKEMPDFDQFDKARADVEFIGLAFEEIEVSAMQAFLKERPVGYPISIVDVYNPPADFETPKGLPMTYLIAQDGSVAKQFLGPITSKDLEVAIANHKSH